jgi:cytochrome c5
MFRAAAVVLVAAFLGEATGLGQSVQVKIYNGAQAKEGLTTYDRHCATCHDGGTMGPELWGDAFLKDWSSKDLAALYTRIQESMPQDNPGTLTEKEVLGLIAFILQQNGFPAGEKPLPESSALSGLKFATSH